MPIPTPIIDNLKFILLEVSQQVEDTQESLDTGGDPERLAAIISRDEYIDSLKVYVENKCFALIFSNSSVKVQAEADLIRAINTITGNLERIADHAVNIAKQIPYFEDSEFIKDYDYKHFFEIIMLNLKRIPRALFDQDLHLARKICTSESKLDRAYKRAFDKLLKELSKGKQVENLITTIFVLRYLERIGDCLLNIGEAIIFSVIGEKLKLSQFEFLEETLADVDDLKIEEIKFEGVWGTRSGCRIGLIQIANGEGDEKDYVFKEGLKEKIETERDKIDLWNRLKPGITAKVLDFKTKGDYASILVDFLTGETVQHYLIESNGHKLEKTFDALEITLWELWHSTLKPEERPPCNSIKQLMSRIKDVLRVHPYYSLPEIKIGSQKVNSLETRLELLNEKFGDTVAPFGVLIHGDFNLDNVFYEPGAESIRFIDVHRSEFGDYVEDVSVFLVSQFRLKIFEEETRSRIEDSTARFMTFARRFAAEHGDTSFDIRLALGLIRNMITSTRFEFHPDLAQGMFHRALYLVDNLLELDPAQDYVIPDSIFVY